MVVNRTSKMLAYINYRMRITIVDGRQIVGRFMAFDRHMNLVLSDAEEFRKLPPKKGLTEEDRAVRRVLGFILLRGEEVVSMTVEGPPPQEDKRARAQAAARGAGRPRRGARDARHGGCTRADLGPIAGLGGPPRRLCARSSALLPPARRDPARMPPPACPRRASGPGCRPRHAPAGSQARMPPRACPRRASGLGPPPGSEPAATSGRGARLNTASSARDSVFLRGGESDAFRHRTS